MKKKACVVLVAFLLAVSALISCAVVGATVPTRAEAGAEDRVTRILLLGCDRTAGLTDSIMLVSLNETARHASVLQIPRDTYAEYTSRDYKKLNGAMNALGAKETVSFLEETLGVGIDGYVVLHPDALVSFVDAIGGVDLEILQDMDYSDPEQGLEIHIPAGKRHLSGAEAEQFVRYRAGYADADLGRLDAQKLFLQAFANRCKTVSGRDLFRAVLSSMSTLQTDIGLQQIGGIIKTLRACDPSATPMVTLPGAAVQGVSGAWYYVVNRERAIQTVNDYLMPTAPIGEAEFDPRRVLDREESVAFHRIYTASGDDLDALYGN